jgi:hypothetical protein
MLLFILDIIIGQSFFLMLLKVLTIANEIIILHRVVCNKTLRHLCENTFIIISLLMFPLLGHRASLWITHKKNGTHLAGPVRVDG